MKSKSGQYEDIVGWEGVHLVFQDLELEEPGPTEENLVVLFINEHKKKGHKKAAKVVADLRGVDLLTLFPFFEQTTKKTVSTETIEIPKTCPLCNHTCYDLLSYTMVDQKHFFDVDRKYSEAKCAECKKWFSTNKNQEKGRSGVIPLPTSNRPAYVCVGFDKDYCACGVLLCNGCFFRKQEGSCNRSRSSRRR